MLVKGNDYLWMLNRCVLSADWMYKLWQVPGRNVEDHSISLLLRLEMNGFPNSCVPCVLQGEICLQSVDFLVLEHMAAQDHIYKTGIDHSSL